MSGPVPVAGSLADIYPPTALAAEGPRWNNLLAQFEKVYGHPASFVARSPGRVNIIGEHIDYSLYSVLPMAITADALLAVSATPVADGAAMFKIRLANVQDAKFEAKELEVPVGGDVDIDATKLEWTNYFKSGLRGALELLRRKMGLGYTPFDMEVLMDGNVPVGGGLSSSAAFVSASALAVMAANEEDPVDKKELTELAIVSERAVGVNSGGMDQAASVFSEQGAALFVSFSPGLAARPVKFPPTCPELCFVIAQSFVTSNKQVTGPVHYNLRVVEVSLAAAYLNAVLNPPGTELPTDAGPLGTSLQGVHEAYFYHQSGSNYSAARSVTKEEELEKLVAVTKETLTQEQGYTKEEIAEALNLSLPELEKRFMSSFPVRAERFKLRHRALHVFTEALRVLKFLTLLERPVHTGRTDTTPFNQELGSLMNETQDSCRDLYECSCPEIDQICEIARAAGAYGSRLTGAGWGGCSVHLVPADKVADVKGALEREYYARKELTGEQREGAVVVSRPAGGSAIYRVKENGVNAESG
ncbi:Galactokinase [Tolypocladium ophioglossoides CBS 100239]|uniref:Galactokinase n=1 Tax=Tolypocladium ophioglossoides (strain CBS 100239) TaxID=1163406 RepID=A0A0L0N083_TOLOC|nr:Galactokinase [Tolypocladium ophioglossoides CBS 100239]